MNATARLCTYNIHAGIGGDGVFRPDRIASVLAEIDADVVALQEVELHQDADMDLLAYLGERTGLQPIAGPVLLRGRHRYGNALLTRLPVAEILRHDLSWSSREPRGAIDAFLECGDSVLRVMATHLGLRPVERREQIRQLLVHLEARHADCAVLMGDFNEWLLWGRPLRWLRRHFAPTPDIRSFPARWPMFALDQVWVEPGHALQGLEAVRTPLTREASDHLPLVAEVTCRPGPKPVEATTSGRSDNDERAAP